MKKVTSFIRNNIKIVIAFILGGIILGTCGAYASSVISALDVSYSNTSSGISSTNVQGAIDSLYTKAKDAEAKCPTGNTCTKTWARVGDYVKMTPELASASDPIPTSMTGYSSSQTINPSELNLWRVIRINSDGTIDMVSEYVSSTNITLQGKTGYQNYIATLNQIAAKYKNSKYTIGSRYVGYGGQTGVILKTKALDASANPQGYVAYEPETYGLGDTEYEIDYNLIRNALGTLKANKAGTTTATYYWIASRIYSYTSSTLWTFNARLTNSSGNTDGCTLYYYSSGSFIPKAYSFAIRPIITLKSGLVPTGSGTSSNPYVLS